MSKTRPGVKVAADPAKLSGLEDREYTTREAAEIFEVTEGMVRRWIASNQLIANKHSRKEGFRIPRSSMVSFAMKRYSK